MRRIMTGCESSTRSLAETTLYIANKSISHEQALAAGADPRKARTTGAMDALVEVDMQGKVVWEWCFFDHVIQDLDPAKANYAGQGKTIADYPGRSTSTCLAVLSNATGCTATPWTTTPSWARS